MICDCQGPLTGLPLTVSVSRTNPTCLDGNLAIRVARAGHKYRRCHGGICA